MFPCTRQERGNLTSARFDCPTYREEALNEQDPQLFSELHTSAGSSAAGESEPRGPVELEYRTAAEVHRTLFSDL
ncbi:hypothetical protein BFN03_10635 [Rhodococcus sp. WMMA185]|nr:hypothetical protein BFN03_10635 [Rhodococcus sp. WMMA185]